MLELWNQKYQENFNEIEKEKENLEKQLNIVNEKIN